MLELNDVTAGYGGSVAVRNVSIQVPDSSVVVLLGPNGAGKSTTLRVASGVMRPTTGRVILDGTDITRMSPFHRTRLGICHLPEGRGIFPSLSVRSNLALFVPKNRENQAFEEAATTFPVLGQRRRQLAGTLSGGEQQMLSLARAYVSKPRVVLVDEPSLGLAPLIVDKIFSFLQTLASQGGTLLMVEQYVNRALGMANSVYVMQKGEVVYGGSAADLDAGRVFGMYAGSTDDELHTA
jgi:branched-chain amino acid transport system ATP-binding protein